jgi:phosphatidylglycerophosphatase A
LIKTTNKIIATFFYSGFFPVAPGTFGSFMALLVWLLLPEILILKAILLGLALVPGFFATEGFARELNIHDPGMIVIDEVAGLWLALIIIDLVLGPRLIWSVLGFLFFRLFDIIKPYPISLLEKAKGAWGIMLDDILAGIFAAIILILINIL